MIRGRYSPFNLTAFNSSLLHSLLSDMGASNTDHDGRYFTEAESDGRFLKLDGSNELTADWDVGSYNIRAASLTADGLASGRVVYTGTDGLLSVEGAFAYNNSTNTLKVDTVQTGRLLAGGVQP